MLTLPTQQPTQQELAALKAAAEALPLSPWSADGDAVYGEDGDGVCVCYHNIGHKPRAVSAQTRARFIGQANPASILALPRPHRRATEEDHRPDCKSSRDRHERRMGGAVSGTAIQSYFTRTKAAIRPAFISDSAQSLADDIASADVGKVPGIFNVGRPAVSPKPRTRVKWTLAVHGAGASDEAEAKKECSSKWKLAWNSSSFTKHLREKNHVNTTVDIWASCTRCGGAHALSQCNWPMVAPANDQMDEGK